ncbi:hypothetical protein PybrP1_002086 [[Pythium] brassicae (nom. inval.)]|nr:hypothetical protein PybrP1_002086 [[Pythium] brassicae (nom. inval.)]
MPGRLLQLLLLALALVRTSAKCAMTQTCVNPGNEPDFDACIPEAHREPVDPQPMVGPQWANVTGGGACTTDADCSDKGECVRGTCACRDEGMVAGAHCELFAIQCPEYKDAACCSWQQNQGMAENFKLVASVFGKNSGGGCDACAANVLSLWCGLTCSPRQHEFLQMRLPFPSTSYRPDPMTGEERVKVLELAVTLDKAFTCRLFDSCRNTAIASMSEAMKSSLGFLNYQVQTGAVGHGQFISLRFADGAQALNATPAFNHSVLQCANYSEVQGKEHLLPKQAQLLPSIASKSAPKQCPCGACRATCDAHRGGGGGSGSDGIKVVSDPISLFDGFNGGLVALVYGGVAAVALLLRWRTHH